MRVKKRQGTDEPPKKRLRKTGDIDVSVSGETDLAGFLQEKFTEHELKTETFLSRLLENPRTVFPIEDEDEIAIERVESIATIVSRAIEVIGSVEKAMRWLHTPVPSLGDTPIRLLRTAEGAAKVENALGAIEDGAW